MAIDIIECTTPKLRREFIDFAWQIYKDDPYWVPPLISDRTAFYDKNKNLFFKHSDAAMFLARRDGSTVGTIAAVHNTRHLEKWKDNAGFFGGFECVNSPDVASALFSAAQAWLKSRGLKVMRGPATLSINDECGLLVEGFDSEPQVLMTYNPRYYADLIEGCGFAKAKDLLAWWIAIEDGGKAVAGRIGRIAQMALKRGRFTVRHINLKRVDEEFAHIKNVLYSQPWEENWGHVTPTDEEMHHLIHQLKQFADEELILVAEMDGQAVGVAACLPNVNHPLKLAYPSPRTPELITLAKFVLKRRSEVNSARFLVMGVLAEHRMAGIDAVLAVKSYEAVKRKGYSGAECSWILENNDAMNRIIEQGGGKIYKRYRLYDRAIAD